MGAVMSFEDIKCKSYGHTWFSEESQAMSSSLKKCL